MRTVELAGVSLQTAEQVFVSSGSGGLDGHDEPGREGRVAVAQVGQLHGEGGQPATQHLAPSEGRREGGRTC